jgi:hypothetical protein
VIFCTHRELYKLRPSWRPADELRPVPECDGKLVVDSESEAMEVWVAVCDGCSFEIGIPPRQQQDWLRRQGAVS